MLSKARQPLASYLSGSRCLSACVCADAQCNLLIGSQSGNQAHLVTLPDARRPVVAAMLVLPAQEGRTACQSVPRYLASPLFFQPLLA
jgi:hypothetical protein